MTTRGLPNGNGPVKLAGVTLQQQTVTWTRWDAKRMRHVTSHPRMWCWTDEDGGERCYDTKREALAAIAATEGGE